MKHIVIFLFCGFALLPASSSDAQVSAKEFNGHSWVEMKNNGRSGELMRLGYMKGFLDAWIFGHTTGGTFKTAAELLEWNQRTPFKTMSYYVAELDSFYETYPLCKGNDVGVTLVQLAPRWMGIGQDMGTYEEIGQRCTKR